MRSLPSLQLCAIFSTVFKLFRGGKKKKKKDRCPHPFFPVPYTITVLSASLLCEIILIFLTQNRKSFTVTLFSTRIISLMFTQNLHSLLLKKYQNLHNSLKFCQHWIHNILLSPLFLDFCLPILIFWFCTLDVTSKSFFSFICYFEVLMRIFSTLQICSVTVTTWKNPISLTESPPWTI